MSLVCGAGAPAASPIPRTALCLEESSIKQVLLFQGPYGLFLHDRSKSDSSTNMLNIVYAMNFITVAKSKMYWQGVKSIALV